MAVAARSGNEEALEILKICGEHLGKVLSVLIDILNPEMSVIGSIYARNPELFDEVIWDIINKEALSPAAECCKIVPAALGDSIGDYAALSVAQSACKE